MAREIYTTVPAEVWHGPLTLECDLTGMRKETASYHAVFLGVSTELQLPGFVLEDASLGRTARRIWATIEATSEPMGVKFFQSFNDMSGQHARRLVYLFVEDKRGVAKYRLVMHRFTYILSLPKELFTNARPPDRLSVTVTLAE